VSFSWGVTKNGNQYLSGGDSNFSFTPDDNGDYFVNVTVRDDLGASGSASLTIKINNVKPQAALSNNGPVEAGQWEQLAPAPHELGKYNVWTGREFIAGLGGMAIAWPNAAGAQQRGPARRIGAFILAGSSNQQAYLRALLDGLDTLGWVDGKNIQVEYRWAGGDVDSLRSDAANLVALDSEVIVSGGTQATTAL
jgi:hypothetical protein